jgi:hypothetical protein
VFEEGHERNSPEHDLVEWIMDNDLLQLIATDLDPTENHVYDMIKKALESMLSLIQQALSLSEEMATELPHVHDIIAEDATRALNFAQNFMLNLLHIKLDTLEHIGSSCIAKLCTHVKQIHEADSFFGRCKFDYHIFHHLLTANMLVSTSPSLIDSAVKELDEIADQDDVLLKYNATLELPMTESQKNLLDVTQSLLAAAKQSISLPPARDSWLNADHERIATNIKQVLNDCLNLLDIDRLKGVVHTQFACHTISTLHKFFGRVCPECSSQELCTFGRAVVLKRITSSSEALKLDGWKSLSRLLQGSYEKHELAKWINRHDVIQIIHNDKSVEADMCLVDLIDFLSDMRDNESGDGRFIANMLINAQKSRSNDDSSAELSCRTEDIDVYIDSESHVNNVIDPEADSSQMEEYSSRTGEIVLKHQDYFSALEEAEEFSQQEAFSSTSKLSRKRRSNML